MSAITLKDLSIQKAIEMYYEGRPETKKEINDLAQEILESFHMFSFEEGPFPALYTLILNAEEIAKESSININLNKITLEKESIKKLLKLSGPMISFNGRPFKLLPSQK